MTPLPIPHSSTRFVREIPRREAVDLVIAASRGLFPYYEQPAPVAYRKDEYGNKKGPLQIAVIGPLSNRNVAVLFIVGRVADYGRSLIVQCDEEKPIWKKSA